MNAKYYQEHREEIREKQREYYNSNKEKFASKAKKWRANNSEHIAEYLQENAVRTKLVNKEWRDKNRVRLALRMKIYRKVNPESVKRNEANRSNLAERRVRANIYRKKWAHINPDKLAQYYQKRRCGKSEGSSDLTQADILTQRELQGGKCYYCRQELDNKGRGHIEHKTPLTRGGHNTKTNIVISCSKCNLQKGRKTEEEYYEYLGHRPRQY